MKFGIIHFLMYTDIPVWLSLAFIIGGLLALTWSSDLFVDGASVVARRLGVSPFIIGMVIIGFGTCAPEFFVSLFSGLSNHANLSLGNAYGSCVFNVAGILGIAAMIAPLAVKPSLVFVGAPLMTVVAALSIYLLHDGALSSYESFILLGLFAVIMPVYCWYDQKKKGSADGSAPKANDDAEKRGGAWMAYALLIGLGVMVGASHLLVWGSVDLARALGVGELLIGLTIVAIGTSIPELATAIAAARKGESELVLGNIVGSNLFNTLCVVGTAGACSSVPVGGFSTAYVVGRDLVMLVVISFTVFFFGINMKKPREGGTITRLEGALWFLIFLAYLSLTIYQEVFHG